MGSFEKRSSKGQEVAKRTEIAEQKREGARIEVLPSPRLNLSSVEDVRREMGRVYRDMRSAKIDTQDGTRLVYVLDRMLKAFELIDFERRISALEGEHEKYEQEA